MSKDSAVRKALLNALRGIRAGSESDLEHRVAMLTSAQDWIGMAIRESLRDCGPFDLGVDLPSWGGSKSEEGSTDV